MCGNINFDSVSNFLADFYHPAREDVDVDVVLINKKLPDMQFNALLKANKKRLLYIMGTVFNNEDLEKTAMEKKTELMNKFKTINTLCDYNL